MRYILRFCFLGLALTTALWAGPIATVAFTGELANIDDSFGLLPDVALGDQIEVSFSYMLSVPDGDPDPAFGIYANTILSASALLGSHELSLTSPSSSSLSFIPGSGVYAFLALADFDSAVFVAGPNTGVTVVDPAVSFALQLLGVSGGMLATDELVPLPAGIWGDGIAFFANRTGSTRVDFRVNLNSLQTSVIHPVPELSPSILIASGLAILLVVRRRRVG